jgi:outer membrane protein assembly factor BamB
MWSQDLPTAVSGPLALAGDAIIFGADDGRVRALHTTTGAVVWVRALGGLEPWIVSTPKKILTGAGISMDALNATTGDVTWTGTYGSPVAFASVSENATGSGTIYAGMSSPDRVVAFGGSSDLRARDIALTQIPTPNVFQASIDASIQNVGDENVSQSFWVSVSDTIAGDTTVLANTTVPYLGRNAAFTVSIDSWNFTAGTHSISLKVQVLPGDRNPNNNTLSFEFFATAGPPKIITVWSPGFWIALIVVGVAGLGAGWLIAVANRRREQEVAELIRSRQEPRA